MKHLLLAIIAFLTLSATAQDFRTPYKVDGYGDTYIYGFREDKQPTWILLDEGGASSRVFYTTKFEVTIYLGGEQFELLNCRSGNEEYSLCDIYLGEDFMQRFYMQKDEETHMIIWKSKK